MALTLVTNNASLNAQNSLSQTSNALSTSLNRLSTGLKINTGADGAAAYVIGQRLQAQVVGLNQAIANTNNAVSMVQTASGALTQITSLLDQARSLALNSANGSVNDQNALNANQAQFKSILSTIDSIANTTQFNGTTLLNGTGAGSTLATVTAGATLSGNAAGAVNPNGYTFTVGTAAARSQLIEGDAGSAADAFTVATAGSFTVNDGTHTASVNLGTTDTVDQAVAKLNAAFQQAGITTVQASNGFNGTSKGSLVLTANNYTTDISVGGTATFTGGSGADSAAAAFDTTTGATAGSYAAVTTAGTATHTNAVVTYHDTNGNTVSSTGVGNTVALNGELGGVSLTLGNSATAGLISSIATNVVATSGTGSGFQFQIGANAGQTATVSIGNMTSGAIGSANGVFLSGASVNSVANAQNAISNIDQAISDVTNLAGTLGAFQSNTLQATATNLQTTLSNTSAAQGTITNTDFATEIANYTKLQTQLQAGATVLSNANQITSLITQLLQHA